MRRRVGATGKEKDKTMYNLDTRKIVSLSRDELKKYIFDCEKDFDAALEQVADTAAKRKNVKLCGLAGPSCSGKTTTSFKLTVKLAARNINVRTVSIDDFFHNRENGPVGADGKPDYESVNYVNLDLLHSTLSDIMHGKTVYLPKYDFPSGRRIDKHEKYTTSPDEVIILEGLHALNDVMYGEFSDDEFYRIFINAAGTLDVDGKTLFDGREIRLMRRLIRDFKYRAADARLTFSLWDNVLKGEDKYIKPFESHADYRLDSMFAYEPCVVRRQVLDVLDGLSHDSEFFEKAEILRKKLRNIPYIDEKLVPTNSLMREFIGKDE